MARLNAVCCSYDSFGNITAQTDSSVVFRYGYTGREFDRESGQYYYRSRYFDPAVGRFISEDLIGFDGSDTNLYRYVFNNSQNLNDPSGKIPFAIPLALLGGAVISGGINYLYQNIANNGKINGVEVGISAIVGATGVGASLKIAQIATTLTGIVVQNALANAVIGGAGQIVLDRTNNTGFADSFRNAGVSTLLGFLLGGLGAKGSQIFDKLANKFVNPGFLKVVYPKGTNLIRTAQVIPKGVENNIGRVVYTFPPKQLRTFFNFPPSVTLPGKLGRSISFGLGNATSNSSNFLDPDNYSKLYRPFFYPSPNPNQKFNFNTKLPEGLIC